MDMPICSGGPRRPASPYRTLRRVVMLAGALALAACSSLEKDATAKWDADRLYKEGHSELLAGNWNHARELLEKLESRYPFGRYAQQGQIEIAYAYYKQGETADALAAHEVRVADYYYRRGAYIAALERAQGALREFPGAAAQQEALTLIAQSYERLGLTELQADAERVLRLNFPQPVAVKTP